MQVRAIIGGGARKLERVAAEIEIFQIGGDGAEAAFEPGAEEFLARIGPIVEYADAILCGAPGEEIGAPEPVGDDEMRHIVGLAQIGVVAQSDIARTAER